MIIKLILFFLLLFLFWKILLGFIRQIKEKRDFKKWKNEEYLSRSRISHYNPDEEELYEKLWRQNYPASSSPLSFNRYTYDDYPVRQLQQQMNRDMLYSMYLNQIANDALNQQAQDFSQQQLSDLNRQSADNPFPL